MTVKLSICIPTYNRAGYLRQTVDSVICQATEDVEVVISDNASSDNTEEVVRELQSRFPRIVYHRNATNTGADQNYLKVVELASGEYCWLLGSDDVLADTAIETLLKMGGSSDIYLLDRVNMSIQMDKVLGREKMLGAAPGAFYDCSRRDDLTRYFSDANSLGSLFSYISCIIVRRAKWNAEPVLEDLLGSAWIHVAKIFLMMHAGGSVMYVGAPLVLNRCENDSFQAAVGYARRRLIDLDYPRVAASVFRDQPDIVRLVTNLVAQQYFNVRTLLSDKRTALRAEGHEGTERLANAYRAIFSDRADYRVKMALWHGVPDGSLDVLRHLYKKILGWRTSS